MRNRKKTSRANRQTITRNGNTVFEILEREMTQMGWTKQRKDDFMQCCNKGKDHREHSMIVAPSYEDLNSSIPSYKPVFSPFIDITADEAYDLCESRLEHLHEFLKKGKYKWHRHKTFRTFMTSMELLRNIISGPEVEWLQIAALITYKEIARQLGLSTSTQMRYYDGNEIDSSSARELRLREAYALVEYLRVGNQVSHASMRGKLENPSLFLQNTFQVHMRAAIHLKDAIDAAMHVRLIGLQPDLESESDDGSNGDEFEKDAPEEEDSDDGGEIQILDYLYRRKMAVATRNAPVTSKAEPKVSAPTSHGTELMRGNRKAAEKEKMDKIKALDANHGGKQAVFPKILSLNSLSNVSVDSKTQPEVSTKKNGGKASSESPKSQDAFNVGRKQAPAESTKNQNESKVVDKKADKELAEKENKSTARDGFARIPEKSNPNGDTVSPLRDGQQKDAAAYPARSVRNNDTVTSLDEDKSLPGLWKGTNEVAYTTSLFDEVPLLYFPSVTCNDSSPVAVPFDAEKMTPELVAELQEEISALRAKNQKVVANLRHKKSLLEEADTSNKRLQEEVHSLNHSVASLRAGLLNVTASRDKLKIKYRIENELLKQARADKDRLERQLKQSEKNRAMERELLDLYRELGNHTGYNGWGKRIRALEVQLSEQRNNSAD